MPREKKEKKAKEPRRKKLKVADFATLPDAIVDGKFVVKLRGRVLFERAMWDIHKVELHRGVVMSVTPEHVAVYDDTIEQWYSFDVHTYPLIKAAHLEDLIEGATPTYGVLQSKIHLPVERTKGAGDTEVSHAGETPSEPAKEELEVSQEETIPASEETDELPRECDSAGGNDEDYAATPSPSSDEVAAEPNPVLEGSLK